MTGAKLLRPESGRKGKDRSRGAEEAGPAGRGGGEDDGRAGQVADTQHGGEERGGGVRCGMCRAPETLKRRHLWMSLFSAAGLLGRWRLSGRPGAVTAQRRCA